jgi:hypothetical protein
MWLPSVVNFDTLWRGVSGRRGGAACHHEWSPVTRASRLWGPLAQPPGQLLMQQGKFFGRKVFDATDPIEGPFF